MKLVKYRVRKFRSVQDSGWVTLDQVNALLGENESGKTNMLLPLWKLRPSSNGGISLLSDAPRGEYTEVRETPDEDKSLFVTAIFELNATEINEIAEIASCPEEWLETVSMSRRFDGKYIIQFPNANPKRTCERNSVISAVNSFIQNLDDLQPNKTDVKPRIKIAELMSNLRAEVEKETSPVATRELQQVINEVETLDMTKVSKTGGILDFRRNCLDSLGALLSEVSTESPTSNSDARKKALQLMPSFIYYSNYGNLDGEIYLPKVIRDLEKEDLPARDAAKSRTLKVLFEFLQLSPEEILEMGKDITPPESADESTVQKRAEIKKERAVLLESAGTQFTKAFSEWWRQGDYVFSFRADGDHFKIWVSDSLRPDPIELENRSAGLQWFFSFFLVFINERYDTHQGSILLLDEPGVTLHPMAQKDLFSFFEGLSKDNQILYTTHSPFLMDPDKLDQVRAVYVDSDGHSCVSSDLRARVNSGTDSAQKAIFPVHSALGLTVSEVMFLGCQVVLVEGPSDQFYLSAIKNVLLGKGLIRTPREIVFVPAGGTRGIKSTSKILSHDEDDYPFILLDGDSQGIQAQQQLGETLFSGREEKISLVTEYFDLAAAEVEDFSDLKLVLAAANREFRGEEDFEDKYDDNKPIIPQIIEYCETEGIDLHKGWKVDIARKVKQKMSLPSYMNQVDQALLDRWKAAFTKWI